MGRIQEQRSDNPRRILAGQFRISTLLWITLVVGAFLAGRYSNEFSTPSSLLQATATATWNPNYSPPIAITGTIDIDGDGTEDLNKLKSLIENNGGTVVAYQDIDGSFHGKIDATTRYLVVGDVSTAASNKLVLDANKNSVRQISIAKLLARLGVSVNSKSESIHGFPVRK